MKYLFLKGDLAKKNLRYVVMLSNRHPSHSTVKNWVARYRTGRLSTEDEHSGITNQVTVPLSWIIKDIH
jgi:hypothetical protein